MISVNPGFQRSRIAESAGEIGKLQEIPHHSHFSGARSLQFQPTSFQKSPSRHHPVAQRTDHKQPMSVLRQTTVSHLRESELPLDDAELMFHLRPYQGLRAVLRAFPLRQLAATVHPDMRLHAEVPLPALARRVHLRVPFLLPVLRRTRCVDDAGIHDRAPVHLQPVLGQVDIDQAEQAISQVVPFHEVAELADGGLVRRGFPAEVDAHEPAHRQGVVQSLLGSRIREIEPVLKEVDAQHPFDSDRPPACTLRLRIERLDGLGQLLPGNDLVHVIQETFLAGLFAVLVEAGIGKRGLAHGWSRW